MNLWRYVKIVYGSETIELGLKNVESFTLAELEEEIKHAFPEAVGEAQILSISYKSPDGSNVRILKNVGLNIAMAQNLTQPLRLILTVTQNKLLFESRLNAFEAKLTKLENIVRERTSTIARLPSIQSPTTLHFADSDNSNCSPQPENNSIQDNIPHFSGSPPCHPTKTPVPRPFKSATLSQNIQHELMQWRLNSLMYSPPSVKSSKASNHNPSVESSNSSTLIPSKQNTDTSVPLIYSSSNSKHSSNSSNSSISSLIQLTTTVSKVTLSNPMTLTFPKPLTVTAPSASILKTCSTGPQSLYLPKPSLGIITTAIPLSKSSEEEINRAGLCALITAITPCSAPVNAKPTPQNLPLTVYPVSGTDATLTTRPQPTGLYPYCYPTKRQKSNESLVLLEQIPVQQQQFLPKAPVSTSTSLPLGLSPDLNKTIPFSIKSRCPFSVSDVQQYITINVPAAQSHRIRRILARPSIKAILALPVAVARKKLQQQVLAALNSSNGESSNTSGESETTRLNIYKLSLDNNSQKDTTFMSKTSPNDAILHGDTSEDSEF